MKRIVILISGRGSNMVSLAQACREEAWPAEVVAVISNRPGAGGLARAAEMGLATGVVDHRAFADRAAFDAALAAAVDAHAPDWLVLAGFMRILTAAFVRRYEGRLVNIHPSLLPSFPGCKPTSARSRRAASCRGHCSPGHAGAGPWAHRRAGRRPGATRRQRSQSG